MNDWLDYKGSGSARAYAADGLMSYSNISHGLFGIQTKKDKDDMANKQKNADIRLLNAYKAKKNNLEVELNKLKTKLKDCEHSIKETDRIIEFDRKTLQDAEISRSNMAERKGALNAHREYAGRIYQIQKQIENGESYAAQYRKLYKELESSISKIEDEVMALDQKITPLEPSLKQRAR